MGRGKRIEELERRFNPKISLGDANIT